MGMPNPRQIARTVEKDVHRVRKHAVFVLQIENGLVRLTGNQHARLGVIAVIGPGESFGISFSEALLCEIGISKLRPWHRSRAHNGTRFPNAERRQWFSLSNDQYRLAAPWIFSLIQQIADIRIARWKAHRTNDHFWCAKRRQYYSRRMGKLHEYTWKYRVPPRGIRFSISKRDRLLYADVIWAAFHSGQTRRHLKGLARFVDICLGRYKRGYQRSFQKLHFVRKVESHLIGKLDRQLPRYILAELPLFMPHGKKNKLWAEIVELTERVTGICEETNPERALMLNVEPGARERMGKIDLKIISEFGNPPRELDYLTFEVFPSDQLKAL